MSKASGEFAACQETTQARIPNAINSGPNLLAGRRIHQYRPIPIDAAVRKAQYDAAATGRARCSLVRASQTVTATIGRIAPATSRCAVVADTRARTSGPTPITSPTAACAVEPARGLMTTDQRAFRSAEP